MAEEGTTFGFVNEYKMNEFTEEERIEFWENYFILERTSGKNAFGAGIADGSWVIKGLNAILGKIPQSDETKWEAELLENIMKTSSMDHPGIYGLGNIAGDMTNYGLSAKVLSKIPGVSKLVDKASGAIAGKLGLEMSKEAIGGIIVDTTLDTALYTVPEMIKVSQKGGTVSDIIRKGVTSTGESIALSSMYASIFDSMKHLKGLDDGVGGKPKVVKESVEAIEGGTPTVKKVFTDNPFDENGKLKSNIKYQTGEFKYNYETDANGRISNWNTDNLQLTEREGRLNYNADTPGKEAGDHAGHLAGDRFGGSPELDNIVSQSQNVNLSQYKKIENQWAKAISEGKEVTVNVDIKYDGDGLCPIEFNVEYTIDGDFFSQSILN